MIDPKAKIIEPQGVRLRDPEDFDTLRDDIYNDALSAVEKSFPQKYGNIIMRVSDLNYADPPTFTKKYEKEAIAKDQYLGRKLRGKLSLFDKEGNLLDEKETTLMRVPYLTGRGTFIHGGNDYGSLMQSRLIPGVYTRRQENGNLETQVNTRPGTGSSFRIGLESDTGQYSLKVRSSNVHLYSLLKDMGVDEEAIKKSWGDDLYKLNAANYDPTALNRAFDKAVPAFQKKLIGENPDKAAMLRDFFEKAQVHENVTKNNLPYKFDMEKGASFMAKTLVNEAMLPPFNPDLSPEDALDSYLIKNPEIYEIIKEASEAEIVPSHLKWLAWYKNYSDGNTSSLDEENKLAWRKAANHFINSEMDSPDYLLSALSWGIDPTNYMEKESASKIIEETKDFLDQSRAHDTLIKESAFSGSKFAEILNIIDNE